LVEKLAEPFGTIHKRSRFAVMEQYIELNEKYIIAFLVELSSRFHQINEASLSGVRFLDFESQF
jgi:hypothetical protein